MTGERFHALERVVVIQPVGRSTFSGKPLGRHKLPPTMKPFSRGTAAVLELDERFEIVSCTEYYDRRTIPGGELASYEGLSVTAA